MKLESTLPQRIGFLSAVPIFDLFGLLLVFFLLGPSLLNQSGIRVEMPVSKFQVQRHADVQVVTIKPGTPPVLWLDRVQLDEAGLVASLAERQAVGSGPPTVYVRSDGRVPAADERRIAELALEQGYRVYLLGRPATDES